MPQERRKVRDVLRLKAGGLSKCKIAASIGVSATAAGDCIRRAREAGINWLLPEDMTDEAKRRLNRKNTMRTTLRQLASPKPGDLPFALH